MQGRVLIGLVTVLLLAPQCHGKDWDELVPDVVKKLERMWQQGKGEVNLLGHPCILEVHLDDHKRHQATFTCPTLSDIQGRATSRNKFGVIQGIVHDYFKKAIKKEVITEVKVDHWLTS
ncbi:anti-lipopolysaccharide factor-like [Homarus americanus]|nr:anti-lipopolysaccharide factor-like [Homarus americanus]